MQASQFSRLFLSILLSGFFRIEKVQARVLRDTTFRISSTLVHVQWPDGAIRGAILMLPGWNYSRTKTCENSSFCSKALTQGFVLIAPEMGKSLYASKVYPNTRKDWAFYPQLRFITDTLQAIIQTKFKLLKPGQNNFIYGLSTGARGGALILENTGTLYAGAALLSGDYNQCLDTADNLMKGFYGLYTQYPERWKGVDNPSKNTSKIKAPIYLGHGKDDVVVPFRQSADFYQLVKKQDANMLFSAKDKQGHGYEYWSTETDAILDKFMTWMKY